MEKSGNSFIFVNIVTVLLCLTAGLSLLFTPMLTVDLGKVAAAIEKSDDEKAEEGESGEQSKEEDAKDLAISLLSGKLKITPFLFLRTARASDRLSVLIKGTLGKDFIEDLGVKVMSSVVVHEIVGADTMEKVPADSVDDILDAVRKAETGDTEGAKADLSVAVQTAAQQLGYEWTSAMDVQFGETFDTLIEKGTPSDGGNFTVERMVATLVNEHIDDKDGEGAVQSIATYEELLDALLGKFADKTDTAEKIIGYASWGVFGVIAFCALMWLLLGIFAFAHIFAQNKTFRTWYVKVFGFLPCLIFGVAPLIAKAALKSKLNATAHAALSAVGSMTWISGACFIALVLVSWVFIYPARRKIKRGY